jgi:hypothetical protein
MPMPRLLLLLMMPIQADLILVLVVMMAPTAALVEAKALKYIYTF